jgi:hypothetical protein
LHGYRNDPLIDLTGHICTSGLMPTLMNTGFAFSMRIFFTIIVAGLTKEFSPALPVLSAML